MSTQKNQNDGVSLLSAYDLFIFDLDGTLYDQHRLRKVIVAQLVFRWLTFRVRFRDLRIIKTFRKLREKNLGYESEEIHDEQYVWCAEKLGIPSGEVREVIEHWMIHYPLIHLRQARYPRVKSFFLELKKHEKKIAIYSDFPVEKKLQALRLEADKTFCSTDEPIAQLKPSKKGMETICRAFNCEPFQALFIGDRDDTDGESARMAGVHFMLVDPREARKGKYYRNLLHQIST